MDYDILIKILQRKKAEVTAEYTQRAKKYVTYRATKDTWYLTKCKELEDLEIKHDTKGVCEVKLQARKFIQQETVIWSENGEIIVGQSDIMKRWTEYIE